MPKEKLWNLISMSVGSSGLDLVGLNLKKQIPISRIVEEFGGSTADLIQEFEAVSIASITERRGLGDTTRGFTS